MKLALEAAAVVLAFLFWAALTAALCWPAIDAAP